MEKWSLKSMSFKKMKKGTKRIAIIMLAILAVGGGFGIYFGVWGATANAGAQSDEPVFDTIETGDISLTVSGSGNLASADTLDISADGYLAIDDVLVKAGDTIDAQQPVATLDSEKMQSYADDLKSEILAQQISIDTTNNVSTVLSIKSPVDGWVKNIILDEDEEIDTAMNEYGYVALIATEEREIINAEASSLAKGDTVHVKCEEASYDGVVTIEKGIRYISIDTVSRTVGANAVVYDADGSELFTGQIELAAYEAVESSYGLITDVKFSEDEEIEAGETIYKATQYSLNVKDMYATLAELTEQYEVLMAHIEAGQIVSPTAGVVSAVNAVDGMEYEEGKALLSVESTDMWVASVSVDELDINSVKVGQIVDVELDSLPNEVFEGTVVNISDMGTASGGITTYNVDVSVEDNELFKISMTLNCEIKAQEATGAVLLPVNDLRTSGNKTYVMVKVQQSDAEMSAIQALINSKDYTGLAEYMGDDAQTLGLRVLTDPTELLYAKVCAVETGIENAYYIEIKSGLNEGDIVLQPAGSDADSKSSNFMMNMGAMGPMGGEPGNFGNRQMPNSGK